MATVKAYASYRLELSNPNHSGTTTIRLEEWQMYTDEGLTGDPVLVGGSPSASSVNAGLEPENAFDGSSSTEWSSESLPGNTWRWIQYDLPAPVAVKSLHISRGTTGTGTPSSYRLLGSNDGGATWNFIVGSSDIPAPLDYTANLNLFLGGISKLTSGEPSDLVRVFDWNSGDLIGGVAPNDLGEWVINFDRLDKETEYLVVHIGPTGWRPICDGPIKPQLLT